MQLKQSKEPKKEQPETPKENREKKEQDEESDEGSSSDLSDNEDIKRLSPSAIYLSLVKAWIKEKGILDLPRVPCGSEILSLQGIKQIEEQSNKWEKSNKEKLVKKAMVVHKHFLLPPLRFLPQHLTQNAYFYLGDRVVVATLDQKAPFGAFGTVVGQRIDYLEVVLDRPFIGGTNLNNR